MKIKGALKMTGKTLFVITGCDSGIGKNLAELLASGGNTVLAGYLNPPETPQDGIVPCHAGPPLNGFH